MNKAEFGKLIKEARIAKKMTQSEVVGTFITRNMLSQIENGVATPSMKTLEYLAGVLDLHINFEDVTLNPAGTDISGSISSAAKAPDSGKGALSRLLYYKKLLIDGEYLTVSQDLSHDRPDKRDPLYDEFCALLASSSLSVAKTCAMNDNKKDAVVYAQIAADYAAVGIYSNTDIQTKALLLLHELSSK